MVYEKFRRVEYPVKFRHTNLCIINPADALPEGCGYLRIFFRYDDVYCEFEEEFATDSTIPIGCIALNRCQYFNSYDFYRSLRIPEIGDIIPINLMSKDSSMFKPLKTITFGLEMRSNPPLGKLEENFLPTIYTHELAAEIKRQFSGFVFRRGRPERRYVYFVFQNEPSSLIRLNKDVENGHYEGRLDIRTEIHFETGRKIKRWLHHPKDDPRGTQARLNEVLCFYPRFLLVEGPRHPNFTSFDFTKNYFKLSKLLRRTALTDIRSEAQIKFLTRY